jgi:hypothetical protein
VTGVGNLRACGFMRNLGLEQHGRYAMIRSSIAVFLLIFMSLVSMSGLAHSTSNPSRKLMEQKGAKFVSKSEFFSRFRRNTPSSGCNNEECLCAGGHDCVVMIEADVCDVNTFICWDAPDGTRICSCTPTGGGGKL